MDYPLPTNDISVSLVRDTLDVSTTNIAFLCTSPNINMWSRRKPVRDPRINIPYNDVGKGSDGMCGLILPPWEGDDTLLTYYAKPRGAGGPYSEPYRLGDFRGYFDDRTLPITLLPKPASISISTQEGTGYLSNTHTFPSPGTPVVTLQDMGMQLCTFYYVHSSHFIGWSPATYFNFGEPLIMNLDVKFGLIPTAQAASLDYWYTELPGSGINIYELPRENTTQNKNWINVPTTLPSGTITNWNMLIRHDLNQLQYSILADYSFSATMVIKEQGSDTIILQFNVSVTANVPTSGSRPLDSGPYVIEPGKTYVGYIYDGLTLKDSKILPAG
jgi:hypothetical protein